MSPIPLGRPRDDLEQRRLRAEAGHAGGPGQGRGGRATPRRGLRHQPHRPDLKGGEDEADRGIEVSCQPFS